MEEQYAICRVAIAPIRAEASDQAEMVSQLLFGDGVKVLEKTDRWWKIQNADDNYEGWVDFKQVISYSKSQASGFMAPAAIHNAITAADGSKYYLPAGSNLPGFNNGYCFLADEKFKVEFEPLVVDFNQPIVDIKELALFFKNAPYQWGGRTIFGIDCSGFVQTVFKMAGLKLKRDASQQVEDGDTVDFLSEARCGDVAFFDNEEGRIVHVGILLSNNEIIHSSGKVKIDPVDDQGIYSKELRRYSHKLRIIKRFF
ncbi:hypothetical protein AAKU52_001756 [Pedobacter sp. CG_S7]|uniref:C40 family peptidase n=1 Tax=Pedobacter sp. CG_S7 TaxID=3143930 RepID=UPI0033956282